MPTEFQVPREASIFLGAAGVVLVLVIIFYLYITRRLCFRNCRRILCLDTHGSAGADSGDESSSSCDSDAEDLKHYKRARIHPKNDSSTLRQTASGPVGTRRPAAASGSTVGNRLTALDAFWRQRVSTAFEGKHTSPFAKDTAASVAVQSATATTATSIGTAADCLATASNSNVSCLESADGEEAVAAAERKEAGPNEAGNTRSEYSREGEGGDEEEQLTYLNEAFFCKDDDDDDDVEMKPQSNVNPETSEAADQLDRKSRKNSTEGDGPAAAVTTQKTRGQEHGPTPESPQQVPPPPPDEDDDDYDDDEESETDDYNAGGVRSLRRRRRKSSGTSRTPRRRSQSGRRAPLPPVGPEDEAVGARCGSLRLTFSYDRRRQRMTLVVHEAAGIPDYDDETTTAELQAAGYNSQVRVLLLPGKSVRRRTKIRSGARPNYDETFDFKIKPEVVILMGVRLRLYGSEKRARMALIGETIIAFVSLDLGSSVGALPPRPPVLPSINEGTAAEEAAGAGATAAVGLSSLTQWFVLEPRYNVTQSESMIDLLTMVRLDQDQSSQSDAPIGSPAGPLALCQGSLPQLSIGLSYNEVTGRLSVEVIKGYSFTTTTDTRSPDTYVKVTLMSPGGQELSSSKTSVRRGQPCPLYRETFMFSVAQFQLPDVSLMVSVYNIGPIRKRSMMGWFTLGYTNSTEHEMDHWNEMRDSKGEQVIQWHLLLEP